MVFEVIGNGAPGLYEHCGNPFDNEVRILAVG